MWRTIKPKMSDKKRIDRILNLIKEIWMDYPDQRFGQLMINNRVFKDNLGVWIEEDWELEKKLEKKVEEIRKKNNG